MTTEIVRYNIPAGEEAASFFAAVRPFFAAIEEMKHYEATRIVSGA